MAIAGVCCLPKQVARGKIPAEPHPQKTELLWEKVRQVFRSQMEGVRQDSGLIPMRPRHYLELGVEISFKGYECHVTTSSALRYRWLRTATRSSLSEWIGNDLRRKRVALKEDGLIVYFSDSALKGSVVHVNGGRLYQRGVELTDGKYLYVLTRDNQLLLSPEVKLPCGALVRHSSLSRGRPVRAAGIVQVRFGRVFWISNNSGHYKPLPETMLVMREWLTEKGVVPQSYSFWMKCSWRGRSCNQVYVPASRF